MTLDDAVRAPEPGDATMQRYLVEAAPSAESYSQSDTV
jgi:hypothetical protein